MKIRKGCAGSCKSKKKTVESGVNTCGIPCNPSMEISSRDKAIECIENAIDFLAMDGEDPISMDSIANLSVVILDLRPGIDVCPECAPELPVDEHIGEIELLDDMPEPIDDVEIEISDDGIEIELEDEED